MEQEHDSFDNGQRETDWLLAPGGERPEKGFRGLRVWRASMRLADHVYSLTENWPRHQQYIITRQVQRSALSIPSNIAEGHCSGTDGMYLRRVRDACGSAAELETQLLLAGRRSYLSADVLEQTLKTLTGIRKALFGLRSYLQRRIDSTP